MIERWKESFRKDSEKAIADIFSGRAGLGASSRRDLPEILFHEFPDQPQQAADRERLDTALLAWLNGMRMNYQREVARLDFGVYSKRLCDALRALQLLDLPRSIQHIREVQPAWLRWLAPLRVAPERDPALECLRLLSQRQEENANPALWLQLASDRRPEYLTVALVGLQRPTATKERQVTMVTALLHHYAQASNDANSNLANFNRHLSALRGRFPRGSAHWQDVLDTALAAHEGHPSTPASVQLRQQIQAAAQKKMVGARQWASSIQCPTKAENDGVLHAIQDQRQETADVTRRYLALVEAYLRFTHHTGDAYFFVRTLCNHGKKLFERADISGESLSRVGGLIEEALRWEPTHEYTWTFWADWFAYQGQVMPQEWVQRETVRMFPDHEASRVELARLLIRQGESHWPEAEQLLREAAERNPEKERCRVELARLLMRRGKAYWAEAEQLLREVAGNHPNNGHSRIELAKLLISTQRREEGINLLNRFLESYSGDSVVRTALAHLMRVADANAIQFHDSVVEAQQVSTNATMPIGALLNSISQRSQLQQDYARAAVQGDPDASKRLHTAAAQGDALAGFYYQWLKPDVSDLQPSPHAWAWQVSRCIVNSTDTAPTWEMLQQNFPEHWEATRFVNWLIQPNSQEGVLEREIENRLARYEQPNELSAIQRFSLSTWQQLQDQKTVTSSKKRKELAFAILHAKAEPCLAY
jgi:tetratricopeptide (TPR) repeat protein